MNILLTIAFVLLVILGAFSFISINYPTEQKSLRLSLTMVGFVTLVCLSLLQAGALMHDLSADFKPQHGLTPSVPKTPYRLLLILPASSPPALATSVADYVNGVVSAQVPEQRVYDITVSADSESEVEGLIYKIKGNPAFAGITVTIDSPVTNF